MNTFKRYLLFFLIGSIGYGLIEILWRGRTHWTMLIAGGICFMLFSVVASKFKGRSLILKAVICSLMITAIEFIFGMVFNVALNMEIWNYSRLPFNIFGQICPHFTLIWFALSVVLIPLADKLNTFCYKRYCKQ